MSCSLWNVMWKANWNVPLSFCSFVSFFQTDSIKHLLAIQYSILTTTSSSSGETERGTWEPDSLFTQWASSQTGVWPADLTPHQTHRVKQPRRIKLSWVRFKFLSATFFHRWELSEKLKRSSIWVFVRWTSVASRIAQLGITTWKYAVKNQWQKQYLPVKSSHFQWKKDILQNCKSNTPSGFLQ